VEEQRFSAHIEFWVEERRFSAAYIPQIPRASAPAAQFQEILSIGKNYTIDPNSMKARTI
jgi:hypothetical protein